MFKKICIVLLMSLSCFATNVYIDTDESTGIQDGTSWSTAYDCLQDAVAARAGVLSEDITFYYKASAGTADVNQVLVTGYTLNGHNIYFVQSDFPADGKWSDSAYRLAVPFDGSNDIYGINITNICRIDGLQVLVTHTGNTHYSYGVKLDPALNSPFTLNKLIIKGNCVGGTSTTTLCCGIRFAETGTPFTLNLTNSVIYNFISSGTYAYYAIYGTGSANINLLNCVIANNRLGAVVSTGTNTAYNCVSFNNGQADRDFLYFDTVEYCATDDTYEGTGNIDWDAGATDWAANFTDYANGDFTIKDNSAGIYHAGTDVGLVTDITGYNWYSTPSIGAFELQKAGKPSIININMN